MTTTEMQLSEKRSSNYQDILKFIAVILMIIDHIGLYFYPNYLSLRALGRYAFPIFAFFAGYNFKDRFYFKILAYGVVLDLYNKFVGYNTFIEANILISIFLGKLYLKLFKNYITNFTQFYIHFVLQSCLWFYTRSYFDYGTLTLAIMTAGYYFKNHNKNIFLLSFLVSYLILLNTIVTFHGYFNFYDWVIFTVVLMALYLSLTVQKFNYKINFNMLFFSKNLLNIYFIHLIIIVSILKYCIYCLLN